MKFPRQILKIGQLIMSKLIVSIPLNNINSVSVFHKIKLPTIEEIMVSKSEIICQFTAAAVKDLSGLEE